LRLQRVQPDGTHVDFEKWKRVKLDVLEGAFKSSPGGFVSYSRLGVYMQDFKRDHSMRVQYTFEWYNDKSKMFLVHKDKWSRSELDAIATESVCFSSNKLWMLPNSDKIMSTNEANEVGKFLRKLSSLNFDSEFIYKEIKWETIGCTYDKEMTWTHPSLQNADLVVENLKKLCPQLEVELEEM